MLISKSCTALQTETADTDIGKRALALFPFCGDFDVLDWLTDSLKTILALLLIGMVVLSAYNVVSRYVFDSALLWADEIVIFAMIVIVWLGGIVCAWEETELRMSLLTDSLPAAVRRWIIPLQYFCVAASCAIATWLSYGFLIRVYKFGMTSDAAGIKIWTVHSSVTIALCLIALVASYKAVKGIFNPSEVEK